MGDRCYLSIYWKKSDTEKLLATEVFAATTLESIFDEVEEEGEQMHGVVFEANYGWWTELTELAKAGVVFHGWHDAGGTYGDGVFCSWDSEYFEAEALYDWTGPAVALDEDGNPIPSGLARARAYLAAFKKAVAYTQAPMPQPSAAVANHQGGQENGMAFHERPNTPRTH